MAITGPTGLVARVVKGGVVVIPALITATPVRPATWIIQGTVLDHEFEALEFIAVTITLVLSQPSLTGGPPTLVPIAPVQVITDAKGIYKATFNSSAFYTNATVDPSTSAVCAGALSPPVGPSPAAAGGGNGSTTMLQTIFYN